MQGSGQIAFRFLFPKSLKGGWRAGDKTSLSSDASFIIDATLDHLSCSTWRKIMYWRSETAMIAGASGPMEKKATQHNVFCFSLVTNRLF
jgi:hypothetical protein